MTCKKVVLNITYLKVWTAVGIYDGSKIIFSLVFLSLKAINKEEDLLQRQKTQFPLLQLIMANKQPFEQLWVTAYEFHTKSEEWMNGETSFNEMSHFQLVK